MVGALSSEHGNNMANKLELANNMANMTKSNLDNIVGSLWQARQESSGSSRGDQVSKNLSWCFVGRALWGEFSPYKSSRSLSLPRSHCRSTRAWKMVPH